MRNRSTMLKYLTLIAIASTVAAAAPAGAQDKDPAKYPSGPIKIVVCVPAGGGVDTVTRIIADKLRQRFGQTVVVENRGGLSGNFGAEVVFAADPDGYTLLASQPAPLTVNALLFKKLNFEPTAFEPVAIMTSIPNTLTVRPDFPAKTAQEFIDYAKANPGKLNYASQGIGTTSHLTAELFNRKADTKLVHVPYKGTAPAINDLIAGHVDLMFTEMASAIELHKAGKARILAVATNTRVAMLPDTPTLLEAGLPDFESGTWNAISAPPKTPPAIVAKLNEAINDILRLPAVQDHLKKLNVTPEDMTPAQASDFIKADTRRWTDVIKAANLTGLE
jgi:tripartite-type tricarboxylate transporter receptor subunit TctC